MTLSPRVDAGLFRGQPAIHLASPDGARAVVLLQGAHLVSWTTADGAEQLFLSDRAIYAPGQPVRGGVPVIFPQFERRGPLPRHGFARLRPWSLVSSETGAGDAMAVLQLCDDNVTRADWPASFLLELTLRVSRERLDVELAVANTGDSSWSFTAALHTYLKTPDIDAVRVGGLQRLRYLDAARGTERVETDASLAIAGEVDRIYFDVARPLVLTGLGSDPAARLLVGAEGFRDAVLWNPGPDKAAALADMPPDGHRRMLCVEAALIGQPKTLAPGEEWVGRQSLQRLAAERVRDTDAPAAPSSERSGDDGLW